MRCFCAVLRQSRGISGIREVAASLRPSSVYQPAPPHVYGSGGLATVAFLAPASKRGVANTRWDVVRVIVPLTDRPPAVQPFDACTLGQGQGKALESA